MRKFSAVSFSSVSGVRQSLYLIKEIRSMAHPWTTSDIPSQAGRLALVTGTGGLGYETALALAQAGAEVLLAGRNKQKGEASIREIHQQVPRAQVRFEQLDVASLASVSACAAKLIAEDRPLDLLINNAGVMTPQKRQATSDGFELQFGTNYLGHFALTAKLLPLLRRAAQARVVNLSSLAHRGGKINFEDLQSTRAYRPWAAYGQSKLAMLMFAFELERRSKSHGWGLMSNAAHPGFARTELIANGPGERGVLNQLGKLLKPVMSQSAAQGALPTLFAATSPDARGGEYYGPDWFYELKGPPKRAHVAPQAKDIAVAARLWEVSNALTVVQWPTA
jgi:NAD(P)-dependent dehydrogenase (short-subunit alcohol dehydrogenase family)